MNIPLTDATFLLKIHCCLLKLTAGTAKAVFQDYGKLHACIVCLAGFTPLYGNFM
jgi:hypothetical protein